MNEVPCVGFPTLSRMGLTRRGGAVLGARLDMNTCQTSAKIDILLMYLHPIIGEGMRNQWCPANSTKGG